MRELIPDIETGSCIITALPTNYKYNGSFIFVNFLTSANKLCEKFPEKTFDEALEIILSAQVYRVSFGENKMNPDDLKSMNNVESIWKTKIKKLFLR
jgi:hypothetical protein